MINFRYNLFLEEGASLSFCSVRSVCDYIDSGGITFIEENLTGCNTNTQILNQCMVPTSLSKVYLTNPNQISPNPGNGIFKITGLKNENCTFKVYDLNGNLRKKGQTNLNRLDLSFLAAGFYLITLETKRETFVNKLVITTQN